MLGLIRVTIAAAPWPRSHMHRQDLKHLNACLLLSHIQGIDVQSDMILAPLKHKQLSYNTHMLFLLMRVRVQFSVCQLLLAYKYVFVLYNQIRVCDVQVFFLLACDVLN